MNIEDFVFCPTCNSRLIDESHDQSHVRACYSCNDWYSLSPTFKIVIRKGTNELLSLTYHFTPITIVIGYLTKETYIYNGAKDEYLFTIPSIPMPDPYNFNHLKQKIKTYLTFL